MHVSMGLLPGAVLSLWAAAAPAGPWGPALPTGRGTAVLIFAKDFFKLLVFPDVKNCGLCKTFLSLRKVLLYEVCCTMFMLLSLGFSLH